VALCILVKVTDDLEVRRVSIIVVKFLLAGLQGITLLHTSVFLFISIRTYKYRYLSFLPLRMWILVASGADDINL
jgi:hypothetical protein